MMSSLPYKHYQQVINFNPPTTLSTTRVGHTPTAKGSQQCHRVAKAEKSGEKKRRTRTGCLSCRQRKKKCDEVRINGKCKACIRNFLPCCWPGEEAVAPKKLSLEPERLPQEGFSKIRVSDLCSPVEESHHEPREGSCSSQEPDCNSAKEAYPSPAGTPTMKSVTPSNEVSSMSLTLANTGKECQFVITSYNMKRELCLI